MELIFEDVSTFHAQNPIAESLLREIDLNKKQTDSDFIKYLPSQPGKEFEIQKRLDRLKGIKIYDSNKNNNNDNNDNNSGSLFPHPLPCPGGGNDLFPLRPGTRQGPGLPPPPPCDFLPHPPRIPEEYELQQRLNQLRGILHHRFLQIIFQVFISLHRHLVLIEDLDRVLLLQQTTFSVHKQLP